MYSAAMSYRIEFAINLARTKANCIPAILECESKNPLISSSVPTWAAVEEAPASYMISIKVHSAGDKLGELDQKAKQKQ